MDNTERPTIEGQYDGRSVAELLGAVSAEVRARHASEVREWVAIVAWADQNVVDAVEGAATVLDGVVDTGVPIAGPGAPLVSEFNLMELIAVLERSPDGGRLYVGKVIECAWRLPGIYASVVEGRIAPWRALRIAELTRPLNLEAAQSVDRQISTAVGGIGWAQLDRIVTEAVIRHDPEAAEARRKDAHDERRFDIEPVDENGLVHLDGVLDAADGYDLNQAVARRAELLGRLGAEDSLDVRRSKAAGELARHDLSLDLVVEEGQGFRDGCCATSSTNGSSEVEEAGHGRRTSEVEEAGHGRHETQGFRDGCCATSSTSEPRHETPGRKIILNVHLTDTSITGDNPVGRWDEGHCPISIEQIREWLQVPGTTVTIRPVIDLKDCIPVTAYEIPERHKTRVRLRDHTCRFPGCPIPARRCDVDHHTPYDQGGPTCPCNEVPLCRRHHRAKTHSLWRYSIIEPGHYLWRSPHGRHFHVGPLGTRALDPPQPLVIE